MQRVKHGKCVVEIVTQVSRCFEWERVRVRVSQIEESLLDHQHNNQYHHQQYATASSLLQFHRISIHRWNMMMLTSSFVTVNRFSHHAMILLHLRNLTWNVNMTVPGAPFCKYSLMASDDTKSLNGLRHNSGHPCHLLSVIYFLLLNVYTWKINMEPTNRPFRQENDLNQTSIFMEDEIFHDSMGSKSRQDVSEVNPPRASARARAKSGPGVSSTSLHPYQDSDFEMNSAKKMFLNLFN